MKLRSYIALDLHHSHTVIEAQTPSGGVQLQWDVPTEPSHLREAVKAVRGPKGVVLEEGPMADWAMRVIEPYAEEVIICDPRRNRLIARDGAKSDDIDAGKLAELYRLGALRAVHHPRRVSMMDLRSWVWAYHDQVALVTAAKNKVKAVLRMAGISYRGEDVYAPAQREEWLGKMPRRSATEHLAVRYGNLNDLEVRRQTLHHRLCRIARRHAVSKKFLAIPGYGPIRALTFLVIVDTPFRFSRVQKLWRYGGLGLQKRQSGDPAKGRLLPGERYNRRLKAVAKGAAERALRTESGNPFEVVYQRLLQKGVKEPLARLTVARKMLSVPWGMWKSGQEYQPALVT
jgi:transposase